MKKPGLRAWAGILASVFLGLVFLVAVWGKMLEPGMFVDQIRLEGLDFLLPASLVAVLALALEAGVGVALLLGVRTRSLLLLTGALVVFFIFLTGRNFWLVSQGLRDPEASCGCFGSLLERTPAEAFWQDLILLVPPLVLLFWGRSFQKGSLPRVRVGMALAIALGAGAFSWFSPAMKYQQVAEQIVSIEQDAHFRPSTSFRLFVDGEESAGGSVFESQGSVALVVMDPTLPGPVLIDPRTREFGWLEESALVRDGIDALILPENVVVNDPKEFDFSGSGITFELGTHRYRMEPR